MAETERKNKAGQRIRERRIEQKLTLEQLSAQLESRQGVTISVSSIAKMERGERVITDVQLMAFAKALKVNVLWLLGLSDDKTPPHD